MHHLATPSTSSTTTATRTMMKLSSLLLVSFLLMLLLSDHCFIEARPSLVDGLYRHQKGVYYSNDYETLLFELNFDEDMYVNQGLLCPLAEQPCEALSCTPCDWSDSTQANFWDTCATDCCGAYQLLASNASDYINEWCEPTVPFTTLQLHQPGQLPIRSPLITLAAGETHYFRFFLPADRWCSPVRILVRHQYGDAFAYYSSRYPLPSSELFDWAASNLVDGYGFAQTFVDLCPNYHPFYTAGTISVAVEAWIDSAFTVELFVGDPYPLVPPANPTLTCADVDPDVYGSDFNCVENTATSLQDYTNVDPSNAQFTQFLLPVEAGCHTITVNAAATYWGAFVNGTDPDVYCLRLQQNDTRVSSSQNSLIGRYRTGSDTVTFSLCLDQPEFLGCAVQAWVPGLGYFSWSSVNDNLRLLATDTHRYDFSISAGLGSAGLTFFDLPIFSLCPDWGSSCPNVRNSYPSDNMLWLFPAPQFYSSAFGDTPLKVPDEDLLTNISSPLPSRVNVQAYINGQGNNQIISFNVDLTISSGAITIIGLTNKDGEPPLLPGGMANGAFDYISHIPVAQLQAQPGYVGCEPQLFNEITVFTDEIIEELKATDSFFESLQLTFDLQVAVSSPAYDACVDAVLARLDTKSVDGVYETDSCFYDPVTEPDLYSADPCCNVGLQAISCCGFRPTPATLTSFNASNSSTTSRCGDPQCAASLYGDLASILTERDGWLVSSCSNTGDLTVESDPPDELARQCREASGFGADFTGVSCAIDNDCSFPPYECNPATSLCRTPSLAVAEQLFLDCFISNMSVSFEDFLRQSILPPNAGNRNSSEFYQAVREQLNTSDCVGLTILDVAARHHREYTSGDPSCPAATFGLSAWSSSFVNQLCPAQLCLDYFCFTRPNQCYSYCSASWSEIESSLETCQAASTPVCNLEGSDCSTSQSLCLYCPADGSLPCQQAPGITTAEQCSNSVACELPDGSIVFGLTAAECALQAPQCNVPCRGAGTTCSSALFLDGICEFTSRSTLDSCSAAPGDAFLSDGACFSGNIDNADDCAAAAADALWHTCGDAGACTSSSPASSVLHCAAYPFGECTTPAQCTGTGLCSDWQVAYVYNTAASGNLQSGSCLGSGYYQAWVQYGDSVCSFGTDRVSPGCSHPTINAATDCTGTLVEPSQDTTEWIEWYTPATTEASCLDRNSLQTYGCRMQPEYRTLWWDEANCTLCGGSQEYAWEWTPGVWRQPVARPLTWQTTQLVDSLQWQSSTMSFMTLGRWILAYQAFRSSFTLRSEVLCRYEVLRNPVSSLTCSCVEGSSECFKELPLASVVAIARGCAFEESDITTPSGKILLSGDSIFGTCVQIDISEITRAALAIPPAPPSVSFQLATPQRLSSPVVNRQGRPVGSLASNGVALTFSDSSVINNMQLCLQIPPLEEDKLNDQFVADFGTLADRLVTPANLELFELTIDNNTYWCTNLTRPPASVTYFAVVRERNYQEGSFSEYSDQEINLSYILGAFYSFDLAFTLLSSVFLLYAALNSKGKLPIYFWSLPSYALLCIFRVVYTFALPSGTWSDNTEANFVVFELPTFFYFSAVIFTFQALLEVLLRIDKKVSRWWRLSLWLSFVLIWLLFIAVAIAVGVLNNQSDSSPCPGRAPASTSTADKVRALSIAYQSIVICFCFALTVGLCFVTALLVRNTTATHGSLRRSLSALREILKDSLTIAIGFITRCILFIIYLSLDLDSSVFIFITLLITEVCVICLLNWFWILRTLNRPHLVSSGSVSTGRHTGSGSLTGHQGSSSISGFDG